MKSGIIYFVHQKVRVTVLKVTSYVLLLFGLRGCVKVNFSNIYGTFLPRLLMKKIAPGNVSTTDNRTEPKRYSMILLSFGSSKKRRVHITEVVYPSVSVNQECKVRWSSTYGMDESLMKVQESV